MLNSIKIVIEPEYIFKNINMDSSKLCKKNENNSLSNNDNHKSDNKKSINKNNFIKDFFIYIIFNIIYD